MESRGRLGEHDAFAEGRAPADLTVTRLARNLPLTWAEQEEQLGLG